MYKLDVTAAWPRFLRPAAIALFLIIVPLLMAGKLMHLGHYDWSVPLKYNNGDATWQFVLSKMLFDTGWVLDNPYLGAPDIAHWHGNPAAQTSALHSILMLAIRPFVPDAITMQQIYFLLNFPLIAATSYLAARLLGVRRWTSCCIGLLFAFSARRLSWYIYSYLANYFIIPLSIVPAIWIMTGRFPCSWRGLVRSGKFWASLVIVVLSALTDGYYAFFTLLLLGFAGMMRALSQRNLRSLHAPVTFVVVLFATAYIVASPLRSFERAHHAEYVVDGKIDPAMIKHPFEAEVYSSSLKLMVAPIANHRIPQLADLGAWMLETSNHARAFIGSDPVQFGALASVLLIAALVLIMLRSAYTGPWPFSSNSEAGAPEVGAILALVLFSFLCAISGGVGSLVALIYPTIRAYERFPLFTIYLLYVGAALVLGRYIARATLGWRLSSGVALAALVLVAILDQTPRDVGSRDPAAANFVADREFIGKIEPTLPEGTEIYQYPYSNYLINSPYYGWGALAHVRFYLHSHYLRWSNGAFKNSPVDAWHMRLAGLPPEQLVRETRAVGFGGFLVDRTVVGDAEYQRLRDVLVAQTGMQPVLDEKSHLAFWRLPPLGYRITYDPDYRQLGKVEIDNPQAITADQLSRALDRVGLLQIVQAQSTGVSQPGKPIVVTRSEHPEAFTDTRLADAGLGLTAFEPPSALQADVLCPAASAPLSPDDFLTITVVNRSSVDIRLNSGPQPLRIGLRQVLGPDGAQLRGDTAFRLAGSPYIQSGKSVSLKLPLSGVDLATGIPAGVTEFTAVFTLVQEGILWHGPDLGDKECRVRLQVRGSGG